LASTTRTPYDSIKRLINAAAIPSWINEYDALRIASYQQYEDIYWTEPDTFKLTQRGNEANPIYIPSGRIICNTMDRYTGQDWTPVVDESLGTPAEQALLLRTITDFIRRERLRSQHETNKLYGIIRADEMWYITGNPLKPQGSRLSLRPIDPKMVIPINPPRDADRVIGYDIVEQVTIGETLYVNRTRYLKAEHPDHPSFPSEDPLTPISWQVDNLEMENWEDPAEQKIFQTLTPPTLMPGIINLPIYHIKNQEEPGNPFGRSEMAGLERIFAAINQSLTDEELALALHGLGMYKSSKGQPIDPVSKAPVPWQLGPGKVVHDETFDRVNGVNSVTPFRDHVKYMEDRMHRVNGASDVAQGVVDVTVAESGIALQLRMGPILNAAGKKNTLRSEVYDQMFYDLRAWFATYEAMNFGEAQIVNNFGKGLPVDVKQEFDRLYQMVSHDPPLITMGYFREACRELGMAIPLTETGEAIANELAGFQQVADPTGGRLDEEIDAAEADAAGATEEV
jgi:hypothetical protein